MTDKLLFAHPPATRARAKAALDTHGSLRKAAAAAGVPKSTIHYWNNNGGFDDLDDEVDPQENTDASISADVALKRQQQAVDENSAPTGDVENAVLQPDGFPETPEQIAGDTDIHDAPVSSWPSTPDDGVAIYPGDGTQDWVPTTPAGLKALFRYANSLIAGATPANSLRAAQVIDPDFGLTTQQDMKLINSLTNLMMDETALFAAISPPPYVHNVYNKYAWDDSAVSDLSDTLFTQYQSAYTDTINSQLDQVGRDPITSLGDQSVLDKLQTKADTTAQGIADSWNKDLANQVGQQWIDLSAQEGNQMSQAKLDDAVSDWQDGRSDYKSGQWANDASGDADSTALGDWQDNNNTVTMVQFVGDDTDEPICSDMLDQYGDWTPIDEAPDYPDYPHTGCVLGDVQIQAIGELRAASRAAYRGQVVTLTTGQGSRISVTPNHPILTGRGWLPAEAIRQGDEVFDVSLGECSPDAVGSGMGSGNIQSDHVPALASDVFNSLRECGANTTAIPAPGDFHGDGQGIEGKVNVVRADGLLADERDIARGQEVSEAIFMNALSVPIHEGALPSQGHPASLLKGALASPIRGVSSFNVSGVGVLVSESDPSIDEAVADRLIGGIQGGGNRSDAFSRLIPFNEVSHIQFDDVALTDVDPSSLQYMSNSVVVGAGKASQVAQTGAFSIKRTEILDVERWHFNGHVYNFETSSHLFSAGGIVTHNCIHSWETQQEDVPADQALWTGE